MKTNKHINTRYLSFGLVILAMVLTVACGAKTIRGAAPMVRMNELSHQDQNIRIQLSMRNLNGVELDVLSTDFRLSSGDTELIAYQGPAEFNIVANGTETWSIELKESPSVLELLKSLESGEVKSLPYYLKGKITTLEEGTLRFEYDGHIYPLPGKPGYFR